jgi:formylglycine-generating enzyme required for sulfatase activity
LGAQGAGGQPVFDSIVKTINPESWDRVGGPGSIVFVPQVGALVVSQTWETQLAIHDLLHEFRQFRRTAVPTPSSSDLRPLADARALPDSLRSLAAQIVVHGAKPYQSQTAQRLGLPVEIVNSVGMQLVLVPADESAEDAGQMNKSADDEMTVRPFYMGACEVTVGQFKEFVSETSYQTDAEKDAAGKPQESGRAVNPIHTWRDPGFEQSDNHPVCIVSSADAAALCQWLSQRETKIYRLPTEAEWQWACCVGTVTTFYFGESPTDLANHAWYADNSNTTTHPVGLLHPNAWSLFDMYGNVAEMCTSSRDTPTRSESTDTQGLDSPGPVVVRGGSYHSRLTNCTTTSRYDCLGYYLTHGFRVVCEISEGTNEKEADVR